MRDISKLIVIFKNILTNQSSVPLCTAVPYGCCKPAMFVIDVPRLGSHKDVVSDGLGSFINLSCDWYYLNDQFERCKEQLGATYEIKSTHYSLKRDSSFKRRIVEIRDYDGNTKRSNSNPKLTLLCYDFKGTVHELQDMPPHGNCKTTRTPFTSTKKSVRDNKKTSIGKVSHTKVHDKLLADAGGLMHCKNDTDYPRNMKQIYNVKATISDNQSKDDLYEVILRKNDPTSCILDVHNAHGCNLAITMASQYQLDMLEALCCDPSRPVVLGIDMTYNCANKFYVTPTVIQHPMLLHNDTLSEPAIMGPTLIHTEHNEGVYRIFAGDLVNARPSLCGIKFLGSDRQRECFKGFKVHMSELKLLLCRKHVEDNMLSHIFENKEL